MARKGWSAASRSSLLATKNIGFCTFRSPRIVVPSSELRRRIINEALYLASIKAGVFQQSARATISGSYGGVTQSATLDITLPVAPGDLGPSATSANVTVSSQNIATGQ